MFKVFLPVASSPVGTWALAVGLFVFNDDPLAVDQAVGQLVPGLLVDALEGGAADIHHIGTPLLIVILKIHETQAFGFLDFHHDHFFMTLISPGSEFIEPGGKADVPSFAWSWNGNHFPLFVFDKFL